MDEARSPAQRRGLRLPWRYLLRRLAGVPLQLLAIYTLVFGLLAMLPDPIAASMDPEWSEATVTSQRARLGLDQPLWQRYLTQLGGLLTGDLGTSTMSSRPVSEVIGRALPVTLSLSGTALALAFPLGIALGAWQARRPGTPGDTGVSLLTLTLFSTPVFLLGFLLQVGATWVGLPITTSTSSLMMGEPSTWDRITQGVATVILPSLAMALPSVAVVARYTRAAVLEVASADHVRTARAKGLPERLVWRRHVLRNAAIPILTLVGLSLPRLVAGSVVVERVFSQPGIGATLLSAISAVDVPLLLGLFLLYGLAVAVGNLAADVAVALADPRVRHDG